MLPAFQNKRVEELVGLFARVAEQRIATWIGHLDPLGKLNLSREMDRIALANIGQGLFGHEIGDRFLDAFRLVMREVAEVGNAATFGLPLIRQTTANRDYQAALGVVENECRRFSLLTCPSALVRRICCRFCGARAMAKVICRSPSASCAMRS